LGVGWIIFCKQTGLRLTGLFWERLPIASSFQAEMLGLCTLHLLACMIMEFHQVSEWTAIILCNSKRALSLSSHHKGQIRPSAKYADIRQSFQASKQDLSSNFKYVHVYWHMDQHLAWGQLSLPQQLNCICNTLEKRAVVTATAQGCHDMPTQILPQEDVALIV
jgi:hypothetical protein